MPLGTILVIILIIFLLGGFSGRFGGYGYGFGHGGVSLIGVILIVVVVLLVLGRIYCRMSRLRKHLEHHLAGRIGWMRAAVLGANDGIISTASLIVGVAASSAKQSDVLIAGIAGLVAGAMSMAAGEYVSGSSQSGTEQADLARER